MGIHFTKAQLDQVRENHVHFLKGEHNEGRFF